MLSIRWTLASILLILLTKNNSEGSKATENTYFDYVICNFNSKFTTNTSCKLNFISRMEKSFKSTCVVTQRMDNVIGSTQLYHKFRNGYQQFLVNVKVNVCDYMRKKAGSKIIDIVLPKLRKYISVNQTLGCPFSGPLNINDLPLSGSLLNNMFLPVGNYMVNLTAATTSNELIWSGRFYFIVPEGKSIEDDRMGR